ncbi:MAG: MFS transporter [Planctomycetes bacterium]|nr:MFS transporter [Planctomycetota bacterium]
MTSSPDPIPHNHAWKRNLAFIWCSQFLSLMGFGFALTFAPYYIQELGVSKEHETLWTGIFSASAPFMLALAAPIWGMLADRYGRRLMLLRANIGGTVMLFCMSQVTSVEQLIVLRLIQGIFTGTVPAAQTLVAVCTPERRQGTALGSLMAGVISGQIAGAAIGGYCADIVGYRACFLIASGITLLAGLLVFGVDEKFLRPEREKTTEKITKRIFRLPRIGTALPVLFVLLVMSAAIRFDQPFLPLFVQQLHGMREGASTLTGQLVGIGLIASIFTAVIMGVLADRYSPAKLWIIAAFGSAVFMFSQGFASGFPFLFGTRAALFFCAGGLHPLFTIWLVRTSPPKKIGSVLGWASSARALGWTIAPLAGAGVAMATTKIMLWLTASLCDLDFAIIIGLRAVFLVAGVLLLSLIPLTLIITRKGNNNGINNS